MCPFNTPIKRRQGEKPVKNTSQHRKKQHTKKSTKTGAGHGVSQRKMPEKGHDVPEKRERKTYLEDEDVPLAHHPPQLLLHHLFVVFHLLLNDSGSRAQEKRRRAHRKKNGAEARKNLRGWGNWVNRPKAQKGSSGQSKATPRS